MRIALEVSESQARTLQAALELYARIGMGDLHDIEFHSAFQKKEYDIYKVRPLLDQLKKAVFDDLPTVGHLYGIMSESTTETSKEAFDMFQVLRYRFAWHYNPSGNRWNVAFDAPTKHSKQELMTWNLLKETE